ncbi:MAG: hypothetical protein ACREYE_18320 [Gammaproteobacteria bacterium]
MKKSAAFGISCSGGARNPHVFQYTLRLLVSSLRLAPAGLARRFAPGETVLRSGGTRHPVVRDDFFTSSRMSRGECLKREARPQKSSRGVQFLWSFQNYTLYPNERPGDPRFRKNLQGRTARLEEYRPHRRGR